MADKKDTRLHELLAVEQQLKGQAETTRKELAATFDKKRHLFEEKVTVFQSLVEGQQETREQQSDINTTVAKELAWITGIWSKALDTALAVQETCTHEDARADVVLDNGHVILRNMPVLALLELEKRANEMAELAKAIPTLDPAKGFQPDKDRGTGIFVAREVRKTRTKKAQTPIVLYPATEQHPAQTQLITEDVPVGTIVEREWSGLVTPAVKADMITRAEELARAIKQARQRANHAVVNKRESVGTALLNYVFEGK